MAIFTHNLQYRHPGEQQSLSFPDLALPQGSSALVLGDSGSGKSTLLHILAGLLPPLQGQAQLAQQDLYQLPPRKRDHWRGQHLGMIFQQHYFLPYLSLAENLALAGKMQGQNLSNQAIQKGLQSLSIGHLAGKKPPQCSVGEQQRASILRATLHQPSVILADEPTSALDQKQAERVAQLLLSAAREQQSSLLIVTHDQRLQDHFDQIIRL